MNLEFFPSRVGLSLASFFGFCTLEFAHRV
jgi:hypothetical protein